MGKVEAIPAVNTVLPSKPEPADALTIALAIARIERRSLLAMMIAVGKIPLLGRSRDGEFRCRYGLMPVAKSLIDALAASA
jgi:hypothetical protein